MIGEVAPFRRRVLVFRFVVSRCPRPGPVPYSDGMGRRPTSKIANAQRSWGWREAAPGNGDERHSMQVINRSALSVCRKHGSLVLLQRCASRSEQQCLEHGAAPSTSGQLRQPPLLAGPLKPIRVRADGAYLNEQVMRWPHDGDTMGRGQVVPYGFGRTGYGHVGQRRSRHRRENVLARSRSITRN